MNKTSIYIMSAAALLAGGCDYVGIRGNGNVVTEQRPVSEFTQIIASGGLKVDWKSGPPSLSITTDENLMRYVENSMSGNAVRLKMRQRSRPTHGIKISVTSPRLTAVDLSGAVDLIAAQVTGPKFSARATGASDITIDGTVDEFLVDMTGATDLHAQGLQTKTVGISSTGASSAKISVSEALRVSITGAGDVTYFGNPKTIEKHVTGAGSVHHKE